MLSTARRLGVLALMALAVVTADPVAARPASAASPPVVVFSGQNASGLLGCTSTPNRPEVTVAAETTVMFVNHLGQTAQLVIDGVGYTGVPANNQIGIRVHRGPVHVTLVPGCLLSGTAGTVTVNVTGVPSGTPQATAPSDGPTAPTAVELALGGSTASTPDRTHVSGLLLLVAAVFILGVSIMAIRAISTQQARNI